ncbi:MAG: ATP-binding cassette domain-containing protein, partial [Anaerolineae bacterium]|nr:ATP-binding cassette domain-containing protein [Anaerolineae bacterium]
QLPFASPPPPPLFHGFDWQVGAGEAWAVIGRSGSGKSTLLYLLAGLRQPAGGEILVGGKRLVRPRPRTGLILQDYGLLPWATVAQNAALGLRMRRFYGPDGRHAPEGERLPRAEVERRVDFWLCRLGIEALAAKYPAQISGGQRQRAAIARTLAMNPDLLLMDEPFSSLDALTREDLERLTLELQGETGLATVIVTHNIEEAVYLGRRLLVLRHPPHEVPLIVDNPAAGRPDYRHDPGFQARCNEVRDLLGGSDALP